VLSGAYVILGLGIPILIYYLPSIVAHSDAGGLKLVVPRQTPVDALVAFGRNAGQLGTLAVIVVAAAGLALDARPALAAFYRSRTRSGSRLLLPRYVMTAAAAAVCFGLGILSTSYETSVLIGPLDPATLAAGFGIEIAWICFCVSVVALWVAVVRTVSAVVGLSLASLLALVFLAGFPGSPRCRPPCSPRASRCLQGRTPPAPPGTRSPSRLARRRCCSRLRRGSSRAAPDENWPQMSTGPR